MAQYLLFSKIFFHGFSTNNDFTYEETNIVNKYFDDLHLKWMTNVKNTGARNKYPVDLLVILLIAYSATSFPNVELFTVVSLG